MESAVCSSATSVLIKIRIRHLALFIMKVILLHAASTIAGCDGQREGGIGNIAWGHTVHRRDYIVLLDGDRL
ncbi:hypothetical protein SDC9_195062 [bioreactor metagenome]|uniref:Uncharacterized protein n=1 Tax=bioreactor metagenome TaxID=1076179 RepID=A0A645I8K9_9ZZZZ